MVKSMLDAFCIKSGILCHKCEEKLKRGQVTDIDLKVIKTLYELEKEFAVLQDIRFHKAVEAGDVLAILVDRKDIGKLLSHGGKFVKAIGDAFGKRIKLLSHESDDRRFLEDLFSPVSILTINTIWIPDGTTETKVILTGGRPRRMPIDLDVAKKLAKELRNMTLRIEFERM